MLMENILNLLRFALAKYAVINEDTMQLTADGLLEEDGRDG